MIMIVPYLSESGKFISSQNTTNHLFGYLGLKIIPEVVFTYSQYCSNYFNISEGIVPLEKLIKIISKSGNCFKVLIKVIVLPEPGGPHKIKGLCSLSQEHKIS